jgi:hypothetical protein
VTCNPATIEVVRHRITGALEQELLEFWSERGALTGERARKRIAEAVCVARVGGKLAGVCSAYRANIPLVGGRLFWVYRSLLDKPLAGQAHEMIRATFEALDADCDGSPGSPIGLCLLLAGAEELRLRTAAEWSEPPMIYAGYLDDGRQVRIGYFRDAKVV